MTKDEFYQAVRSEGIRPDAFDLDGQRDETYVLTDREGRWDVYYRERGSEAGARQFTTEAAALEYLLQTLRGDTSTKL